MTESFKFSTKRTVLLLFWLAIWNLEAAALSQQDIQTLKAFYDATGGPGWKFGTGCSTDVIALKERARAVFIPNSVPWDFSSSAGDPCDGQKPWFGVTCSAAREAIVGINLQSYGLRTLDGGGIPSSIGQLSSLTFLNLGDNCVSGPIPAELLGMQSLEDLMLFFNSLDGTISQHVNVGLKNLRLDSNLLTGVLPTSLGSIAGLATLVVSSNNIIGAIPSELGQLHNLVYLNLEDCSMGGALPSALGGLGSLTALNLGNNDFSGTIPSALGLLTNLKLLDMSNNDFASGLTGLATLPVLELLDLSNNVLTGNIPSSFGQLSNLISLNLASNRLSGPIPTSALGGLRSIKLLGLNDNVLSSTIPTELGALHNLQVCDLSQNGLTGPIPSSLGQLTALKSLTLASNSLTSLPSEISRLASTLENLRLGDNDMSGSSLPSSLLSKLTSLEMLDIGGNGLVGSLTSSIGNMTSLVHLALRGNRISKSIPSEIGALTQLAFLDVANNVMTGSLPSSMGRLILIEFCDLSVNQFSSSLPSEIGNNWSKIKLFEATGNLLSGSLPTTFGGMSSLTWLGLANNKLAGPIPPSVYQLTTLKVLGLHENELSGSVSSAVGNLVALTRLGLGPNKLTGVIPSTVGSLTDLHFLYIQGNSFVGSLPLTLAKLTNLQTLACNDNALQGQISPWLLSLVNLEYLQISNNLFSGQVPSAISTLTNLVEISAANNRFLSTIPSSLGSMLWLKSLDVSGNQISGNIPSELGSIPALRNLQLSGNNLQGTFPTTLCQLKSIEILDLSYNDIREVVPSCVTKLPALSALMLSNNAFTSADNGLDFLLAPNLQSVDLSNNAFEGTIPASLFTAINSSLTLFAAGSNCLHGSIPAKICEAKSLEVLVLDGLSAGPSCRQPFFTNVPALAPDQSSGSDSMSRRKGGVSGSIPECLLTGSLPNLRLLHLAGNGFSGMIPETSLAGGSWPSSLRSLSLSHNLLTSSIPTSLQRKSQQLDLLDLSFNRLDGDLVDLQVTPNRTVVALQMNRFSGMLSSSVIAALQVRVLEGSLIDCTNAAAAAKQLPANDPYLSQFQCGSHTLNGFLVAFAVVGILVVALLLQLTQGVCSSVWTLMHPDHSVAVAETGADDPAVHHVLDSLGKLRRLALLTLLLMSLVLIPTYATLSELDGTHSFLYAWTVSAAFKGGETSACIFLVLWVALLMWVFFHLASQYTIKGVVSVDNTGGDGSSWQQRLVVEPATNFLLSLRLSIAVGFNLFFSLTPSICFVLIMSRFNSKAQDAATVFLAVYHLIWNRVALPALLGPSLRAQNSGAGVLFETMLLALNLVVLPIVAALVAAPDCFSYGFNTPAELRVTSSYSTERCGFVVNFDSFTRVDGGGQIFSSDSMSLVCEQDATGEVTFIPSFDYSYQCSASLLQMFTPVYLLMALYSFVGEFLLQHSLRRIATIFCANTSCTWLLAATLPRVLLTSAERHAEEERQASKDVRASSKDARASNGDHRGTSSSSSSSPSPSPATGSGSESATKAAAGAVAVDDVQQQQQQQQALVAGLLTRPRVINVRALFMSLVQDLLLLFSFGTAQPLLGIVLVCALVSRAARWHHIIAAFAADEEERAAGGVDALVCDCRDFCRGEDYAIDGKIVGAGAIISHHPLVASRWVVVLASSLLLSGFLLDVAGDHVGFKDAMWAPVLMWILPVVFCFVLWYVCPCLVGGRGRGMGMGQGTNSGGDDDGDTRITRSGAGASLRPAVSVVSKTSQSPLHTDDIPEPGHQNKRLDPTPTTHHAQDQRLTLTSQTLSARYSEQPVQITVEPRFAIPEQPL